MTNTTSSSVFVPGPLDLAKVKAFDRLLDALHEFDTIDEFDVDGNFELYQSIVRLGVRLLGSRSLVDSVLAVVRDVPSCPAEDMGLLLALGYLQDHGRVSLDKSIVAQICGVRG